MEMDNATAYEVIKGVMSVLEEESHEAGTERIHACLAALDRVASWLDLMAEAEETLS